MRQIGTGLVDPTGGFGELPEKMSTTKRLEALNLEAQLSGTPVPRKRMRRTDEDMIRLWASTGHWPERFFYL